MIKANIESRQIIYDHFKNFHDPYFGVVIPFDVTTALDHSKKYEVSFFARYLHDTLKALMSIENFRWRIIDDEVFDCEVINASATMLRKNNTFGCSFVEFHEDINKFQENIESEKKRVFETDTLLPPTDSLNCIHCSALPWFQFVGHKEPHFGAKDSVPKLAFSKTYFENNKSLMNIAINVHHGLVDGYHVGLFSEKLQQLLNEPLA